MIQLKQLFFDLLGVTIGVTETLIPVSEDIGVREVCAVVFAGDLERNVEVTLSLNPLNATGKLAHYDTC